MSDTEERKKAYSAKPSVAFATCCWEKDWRPILLDPEYLSVKQIQNHCYPFKQRLLVINNVSNLSEVIKAARVHLAKGTLTHIVVADDLAAELLPFFHLSRADFENDWVYYNALAPLAALYACQTDFLLYHTGDVWLEKPVSWIKKALAHMAKNQNFKVANLTWNQNYAEAKKESQKRNWNFYISDHGFSDQMFLVRLLDFRQPIYLETHPEGGHYPRGNVFERRIFSYMKNHGWQRLTYRWGSYIHQNFI